MGVGWGEVEIEGEEERERKREGEDDEEGDESWMGRARVKEDRCCCSRLGWTLCITYRVVSLWHHQCCEPVKRDDYHQDTLDNDSIDCPSPGVGSHKT